MTARTLVVAISLVLGVGTMLRAENDLEDLALLTQDPEINAALHQVGKVPLSSNTIGYDPCDDPIADAARKTGCEANGKIEHIIYIVLENHTFDNYYGNINEDETRVDPSVDVPTPANTIPQKLTPAADGTAREAGDYRFPTTLFHLTEYCGWSDLGHGWDDIHHQVNRGRNDGYLTGSSTNAPSMGLFEYEDLAYYYELAKRFSIADRFFTSAASQSWPNHYYTVSGTSGGYVNNDLPVIQDPGQAGLLPSADPESGTVTPSRTGHVWRTIFDSLEEGGQSWKIYMTNIAIPMAYSNFKKWTATGHVTTIAQFYADLAAGTLPQVVYLSPGILISDEHPSTGNHQRGQLQVSTLVNALMASPHWSKSVMFVLYDDAGGWYDHVPPPRAYQPNDRCEESPRAKLCNASGDPADCNCLNGTWVPGSKAGHAPPLPANPPTTGNPELYLHGDNFDLLGARIPFTIVSPWLKSGAGGAGYVTHHVYETATLLSFIEWRFGLSPLNDRTRAYKEGWRNPGCAWNGTQLAVDAAGPGAPAEVKALAWSVGLEDPFRRHRCEPCSPAAELAKDQRNYCGTSGSGGDPAQRAVDANGDPITLAHQENRYLDPLLDPFDFTNAKPGLLDGAAIVAELPPLSETDLEEMAACPANGSSRSPLAPSEF